MEDGNEKHDGSACTISTNSISTATLESVEFVDAFLFFFQILDTNLKLVAYMQEAEKAGEYVRADEDEVLAELRVA